MLTWVNIRILQHLRKAQLYYEPQKQYVIFNIQDEVGLLFKWHSLIQPPHKVLNGIKLLPSQPAFDYTTVLFYYEQLNTSKQQSRGNENGM